MAATVTQNWDNDGHLVITGAETLDLYHELRYGKTGQADFDKLGIFCAFSNEQFDEGYAKLVRLGHIKDGEKVVRVTNGTFGTREGRAKLIEFYDKVEERIKKECDPQEVYYFEYNNYECCISWDGDLGAIKTIIRTYGPDVARKIKRLRACEEIDAIIAEMEKEN